MLLLLAVIAGGILLTGLVLNLTMLTVHNYTLICIMEGVGRFFYMSGLFGFYLTVVRMFNKVFVEFGLSLGGPALLIVSLSESLARFPGVGLLVVYVISFILIGIFMALAWRIESRRTAKIVSVVITTLLVLFLIANVVVLVLPTLSMVSAAR